MIVIKHSVNSIEQLKSTPTDFGVHAEIRSYNNRIIINRDAFLDGDSLEDYIKSFKHSFLVLDVKTEGIENKSIEIVEKAGIKDYIFVNVPSSSIKKFIGRDFTKFAVRFSDMEPIESLKFWEGRAQWVWVDIFRDFPLNEENSAILKKNFKVCTISPEIIGIRAGLERYRGKMMTFKIDAVCTDLPELWKF